MSYQVLKWCNFLFFPITLPPLIWSIWNLELPTFSMYHGWFLYFQGQQGHIKARKATFRPLFNFFWKFSKVYPKGAGICKKKVFWKNVPRLPAFKTTFSFWKNFLWSYPSKLNQIQIMWLFWPKIYFHFKILVF